MKYVLRDGTFYREHFHSCEDCGQLWQAFWVRQVEGHKIIDCPCGYKCEPCTEIAESTKPAYTKAWSEE